MLKNHRVTAKDGVSAEILLSEVESSQQPIVICLPAMGVSARNYRKLAEALVSEGLACGLFEIRGLGSSSVRASRAIDYGYHEILNLDLPATIEFVKQLHPSNPIYLVGHSIGGQFGLLYMAENQHQISGLVGVATGLPHYKRWPFPKSVGLWVGAKLVRIIANIVGYYPGKKLGFAGRESKQVMSDWSYSVVKGDYRIAGQPHQINLIKNNHQSAALILTIEKDWMAPPHSAKHLGDKLSPAKVDYHHLNERDFNDDSLGHFNWMQEPQPIAKKVAEWIKDR
ncbi:alpha/beta fold hydrolase [Aliikangiella marina]|uniref:Alpha/beta fold hydrolase n=1 Tax=Aliikangiella marina TaxID=1712262 RepID=A0A545T927_9GAMM|nr:alpha/beta fold hydrolase [Aliikangiella marina]TQV73727.1 alpha/beta fold hydrolase [Aliikangiella marina]